MKVIILLCLFVLISCQQPAYGNDNQSIKESISYDSIKNNVKGNDNKKLKTIVNDAPRIDSIQISLVGEKKPKELVLKKNYDFNIIRTEKNSGPFRQIKIYALVDIGIDSLNKKNICDKIKTNFNEYSNIIICLYANNDIGKKLAENETINMNAAQRAKNWLALFTFNGSEGEYFDSNPGGYLDVY